MSQGMVVQSPGAYTPVETNGMSRWKEVYWKIILETEEKETR